MGFGKADIKAPTITMPPPSAHPAVLGSTLATTIQANQSNAGKKASNLGGTVATSPQGLSDKPATAPVTLLGQNE